MKQKNSNSQNLKSFLQAIKSKIHAKFEEASKSKINTICRFKTGYDIVCDCTNFVQGHEEELITFIKAWFPTLI